MRSIGIAIVFRGDRGLEHLPDRAVLISKNIAIVFRGDRGLEPSFRSDFKDIQKLRSSFGAIEDWNSNRGTQWSSHTIAIVFRGDRGLERLQVLEGLERPERLRSSFGAIEDWNISACCAFSALELIAIVFRGDRGLEQ